MTNGTIPLTRDDLKALQQITHAAGTDDTRPMLCAVRIDVEAERLVLSVSDAYVLVRRHLTAKAPDGLAGQTLVVDAKDLRKAVTVALWDKGISEAKIRIAEDVSLAWPRGAWILRTVEGSPLDLSPIISGHADGSVSTITVNPTKLDQVAKALGLWPLRNGDGLTCTFQAADKAIRIVAVSRSGFSLSHPDDFAMAMPVRRYDR